MIARERLLPPSRRLVPFVREFRSVRGGPELVLAPDDGAQLVVNLAGPLRFDGVPVAEVVVVPARAARWSFQPDARLDALVTRFQPGGFLPSGHGGLATGGRAPIPLDLFSDELALALVRELGPKLSDTERAQVADTVLRRALRRVRLSG